MVILQRNININIAESTSPKKFSKFQKEEKKIKATNSVLQGFIKPLQTSRNSAHHASHKSLHDSFLVLDHEESHESI